MLIVPVVPTIENVKINLEGLLAFTTHFIISLEVQGARRVISHAAAHISFRNQPSSCTTSSWTISLQHELCPL